jgi:hypothetical protein
MPIPNPEPGLVVSYAYLWHHEYEAGRDEGQKDRPSGVVLAVEREADGATVVIVLPITHSAPIEPASAVEIPLPVKRHLGLDDHPSWIVVSEGNEFVWQATICESCPRVIATITAFSRRDFTIKCLRPSPVVPNQRPPRYFSRMISRSKTRPCCFHSQEVTIGIAPLKLPSIRRLQPAGISLAYARAAS